MYKWVFVNGEIAIQCLDIVYLWQEGIWPIKTRFTNAMFLF